MCGIAGIYLNSDDKPSVDTLKDITQCLSHRGPDDVGFHIDQHIGLGHQRLSIIDLQSGHQPMGNEDNSIIAIFNGEIYNFQALKEFLVQKGHIFKTHSDTEVLVHLYEEFQDEFVQHLRGMFAIALWDMRNKKLILVRDRMGIKPLYYYYDVHRLIFGSEIKAILNYPQMYRCVNFEALHDYLSFMTTSGSDTIFDRIKRLLPGEMLICTQNKIEKKFYWDLDKVKPVSVYHEADFENLLTDVIKQHLISDVPLGAFLSGGLDSSAVVALMSRHMAEPVKTFSIAFKESKYYDESPFARRVAEYLKTDHQEFVVSPDLVGIVPKMIEHFDEPFAVSSALPLYFLSQLAREKVKVVLTGDGADELLAGYQLRYYAIRQSQKFDRWPILKNKFIEQVMCLFAGKRKPKVQKFFKGLRKPLMERYFSYMAKFDEEQKKGLYTRETLIAIADRDSRKEFQYYFNLANPQDFLNRWLYVDMKTSLPNEMLAKVDRMSMAFGLEARVPFLDHALVEYLYALPSDLKLKGLNSKFILRQLMKKYLPPDILGREKHGFEVPVDEWMRKDLKEFTRHYLEETRIKKQGIFNWDMIKQYINLHDEGKVNLGHQLWILLMFQVWHEKYIRP